MTDRIHDARTDAWQSQLRALIQQEMGTSIVEGEDSTRYEENGRAHREFSVQMFARPEDVATLVDPVIERMARAISTYVGNRRGLLYWRVRPEITLYQAWTNKRYHSAGTQYDPLLDKMFDGDGRWIVIAAYARLSRSEPVSEPAPSVITAIATLHSARRT